MVAVGCCKLFSGAMFVFDILQIPSGCIQICIELLHPHAPRDCGPDSDHLHTCLLLGEVHRGIIMMIFYVRHAFTLRVETSVQAV